MTPMLIPVPGLGQTASPEPCGLLDTWMGTCVQNPETVAETTGSYQCNWLQSMIWPSSCASAATSTPTPPTINPAPTIASVDPVTGAVTMLTPQQQQQLNVASIQQQAQANAPVDCTQWYNQFFSPACPCTICTGVSGWALVGVAGVLLLLLVKK
jgi:hypothetical protein